MPEIGIVLLVVGSLIGMLFGLLVAMRVTKSKWWLASPSKWWLVMFLVLILVLWMRLRYI